MLANTVIDEALELCIEVQLWSGNDLRDRAKHLIRIKESEAASNLPSTKEIETNVPPLKAQYM